MLRYIFKLLIFFCLVSCTNKFTFAQIILNKEEQKDTLRVAKARVVAGEISGTDTVLYVNYLPVVIMPRRVFKNEKEKIKYTRLMYNVKNRISLCADYQKNLFGC
jgi:hypothetical protein